MLRNLGIYHNPLKFMNFFYKLRQHLFSEYKTIHLEKEGFKICFYLFEALGNQRTSTSFYPNAHSKFIFFFVTIQGIVSFSFLSATRTLSISSKLYFLIVEMQVLIQQKYTASYLVLKFPDIFCCDFIVLMFPSSWLFSNETLRSVRNLRIFFFLLYKPTK